MINKDGVKQILEKLKEFETSEMDLQTYHILDHIEFCLKTLYERLED